MLGLLPFERRGDELPKRTVRRRRDQQPIGRHQQDLPGQAAETTAACRQERERHGRRVAGDEVEPGDRPEREADQAHRPRQEAAAAEQLVADQRVEPGMHQRRQHGAAHHHLKGEEAARAELPPQGAGLAHMHEPGLHETLEPAGALADPAAEPARRFLVGGGGDHLATITGPRQPRAEIGVLGDVERVPRHQPFQCRDAKMIGGATERDRQLEPVERRQQPVEQGGVFEGELRVSQLSPAL
ncbi:hypothetical protein AUC69_00825 [Methyloceanibacter superfactus]|uniref:Uncharacterized protein n=1 Tax=Methyloceanibacter superfactus TaxID=1774969 RepID=A0A1E3W3Q9_9HYPH|nr:hypothetical protein AUC69_00825 [Methyloceanibacter superfactus]